MLLVHYPKCSTCQKAKKWLEANHIEFEDRHIVEQNPTEEQYALLATAGMLVKRPSLVTDTAVVTGFREKEWEKLV